MRFLLIVILGVFLVIGYPLQTQSDTFPNHDNAQHLLQQGLRSYKSRNYEEAYQLWRKASQVASDQDLPLQGSLALNNQSLALQNLGRWQEAETAVDQSMALLTGLEDQSSSQVYHEILAKVWNTRGQLSWIRGDYAQASQAWEEASHFYDQANKLVGMIQTQLNRSKALQALGLNYQSLQILEEVHNSLDEYPNSDVKATVLESLGLSFRRIGRLSRSREILMEGLTISEDAAVKSSILSELANTERYMADLAIERKRTAEAMDLDRSALNNYRQAISTDSSTNRIRPYLNQQRLLLEKGNWSDAVGIGRDLRPLVDRRSLGRISVEERLSWIYTQTCLKQVIELDNLSCISTTRRQILPERPVSSFEEDILSWDDIVSSLNETYSLAQEIDDPVSQSQVLTQMGHIFELRGQTIEAQRFTEQAIFFLEGLQAPEVKYRLEWQLGRILAQQGKRKEAIGSYESAISTLGRVRGNLINTNTDTQFTFRDNIEPIYRELVELLLVVDSSGISPSNSSLERAIELIDELQLAELENFLRCNLIFSDPTDIEPTPRDNSDAAFIYPIILEDRVAVISRIPDNELTYHEMFIDRIELEMTVNSIQESVLRRDVGTVTARSGKLYNGLILPLEDILLSSSPDTIVFVLDRELRNIPMSLLYDVKNDQYLVEKPYSVAILPTSKLFNQKVERRGIEILAGGISIPLTAENIEFSALDVENELNQILAEIPGRILLDRELTRGNIQANLDSDNYSVLHLATHGNFSSDPEDTYILIHSGESENGQLLRPDSLDILLDNSELPDDLPLDLLVLSACKTAEGDNRAPLGLAGIAIQSGVKSTVATLWQVSDESIVEFMAEFYKLLDQPGMTLSEAVKESQLALLDNPRYQNPYFWAPYVLVGNWQ